MKLTVVIPYTHGDEQRQQNLLNLLSTIAAQTFTDYELIIVEEVIGDNTEKAPYNAAYKYFTLRDNRKFNKSWCINVGIRNANGDGILVLDADMTFKRDYFEKVVTFSKQYPKFFNGFNYITLLPGKDNPVCRVLPYNNQAIIGGAWYTSKKFFFEELGGFNEDYFGYGGEDNDTGERAKFLLKNVPELIYSITHQYHDWHKPDGANPLNPDRTILLSKAKQDPSGVISKLKSKQLGNILYPTLIYGVNMYSQSGEERIINKYLGKDPSTYKGKYIDIGADHPTKISNTYYYYNLGWNGLLIEPNPKNYPIIREIRPRDTLLPTAISDFDGKLKMCDAVVLDSSVGDFYFEKFPNNVYEVECMTIETLLKKYPDFTEPDFISIDAESSEDKILSKCNFEIFKPKIIVIEYWERGKDEEGNTIERMDYRSIWEHFLLPYYDFKEIIGGNVVYLRK